ncbi:MAG TPA: aminofutalosine synthase MqnE [Trueperaceae bacterium]|nr:aminofutalosine synthase MqnE [Trueperaceae bacterium]
MTALATPAVYSSGLRGLSDMLITDPALERVADKVLEGRRLDSHDGMVLYRTRDVPALMRLADHVRREKVGDKAYYVHSLRLSQTNICYVGCTFCGFQRRFGEEGVWDYDLEQVWEFVDKHYHPDLTEIHISSGHHPKREWQYYLDLVKGLTERYPGVQVKAWTGAEIHHFTKITRPRLDYREVLAQLKDHGLVALPGGGAEIFAERVRKQIARAKVSSEQWLEIHGTAHELGLPTNATMLYGHIETLEERLDHMLRLRDQQDQSGGFLSFIPLAFQPDNNQLAKELGTRFTTGLDDLRNLAVARLMLDNFPHIKGYWIMITPELTQVSLSAGVSDIDGTIKAERIAHASGAVTEEGMTEDQLLQLIRDAGRVPVRRDALYKELQVFA